MSIPVFVSRFLLLRLGWCGKGLNDGLYFFGMSATKLSIPPEFDAASEEQRIAFVQELWDRIAQNPDKLPVPEHHRRILDERLDEYRANPQPGRPWSEVREELLTKLGRS